MNYSNVDDPTLIEAVREGDLDAFEALVKRHQDAVYAHALRFFGDAHAAQDAAQEVFIKVFRGLDGFDGRSRFSTWLYRVTRNVCLDQLREGKRRPEPADPLATEPISTADMSDEIALSISLEDALRSLSPEDRDALSAVTTFGLSYAEAGSALGVPAGTVKSRVFRARRLVAASLNISRGGETWTA